MWILPKQLHTSAFVPAMEALISDLNEQSQVCAQSLLVRSKVSPARTWSLKWKRDSWTQLLSGRILKPSHGQSFTAAWTSSLAATRASHSAQPASDSAPKTHGTSGPTYQPELLQCDQVAVSLKTSKDISRWGFPTCCKTWQEWVTERRGAWRQRVNAARLTSGSGSLSWPTATATDSSDMSPNPRPSRLATNRKTEYLARMVHWPTVCASEVRQGFQDRSRGMKGSQESLTTAVILHGQAAPASSSSHGSRQGLSWATPAARDTQGQRGAAANARKGNPLDTLPNQMAQWGTPTARDHKSGRGNEERQYKELTPMVERQQSGKLNPRWVETLMGLPIGWTMPSCTSPQTIAPMSCDSSAMELCQPPQSEPSEFSLAS